MPRPTTPARCPSYDRCELRPRLSGFATLRVWEALYCRDAHETCVRLALEADGREVPLTLLPNGRTLDTLALPSRTPVPMRRAPS